MRSARFVTQTVVLLKKTDFCFGLFCHLLDMQVFSRFTLNHLNHVKYIQVEMIGDD